MRSKKLISRLLAKSLLIPLSISCFNFCCVKSENISQKDLVDGLYILYNAIRKVIDNFAYLGVKASEQQDKHLLANLKDIYDYINSDKLPACALYCRPIIKDYIKEVVLDKTEEYYRIVALCFLNNDNLFPKFLKKRASAYIDDKIQSLVSKL